MGHIVFGAPPVDAFVLHERLQRELRQRSHRTTTMCLDAAEHAFCASNLTPAMLLCASDGSDGADIDIAALLGLPAGMPRRARRWLARAFAAAETWFAHAAADLLLLHARRGPMATLLQFVARRHGVRVLWTGPGLLPHTLQCDERGVDGDAAASQRSALDYRVVQAEPQLLAACLANALARTPPFALPPAPIVVPPLGARLAAAMRVARDLGLTAAGHGLAIARRAEQLPLPALTPQFAPPPKTPYVAVLLQSPADERLRLDAERAPSASAMLGAVRAAAAAIDPALRVVAVGDTTAATLAATGCLHAPAGAAVDVVAAAAATITVNHPLAAVALLAGTPVVHFGRALYGLPGVTTRCRLEELPQALHRALQRDHPTLRARFLTWLFGHGHLWCSPTHPDHNGVLGFVQAIEARLSHRADEAPLRYRNGPGWPLAAPGRSH
jgi:hypothetical protein